MNQLAPRTIVTGLAGTGYVPRYERANYRPASEIAEYGLEYDRLGYPHLALWFAMFIQSLETIDVLP